MMNNKNSCNSNSGVSESQSAVDGHLNNAPLHLDRLEILVSSFTSLLSCAHTNGSLLNLNDSHSLSSLLSASGSGGKCTIPSLQLKNESNSRQFRKLNVPLPDVMALNLATTIEARHGNIDVVPSFLLRNIKAGFEELITSRLRVSLQAITRTVLKTGGDVSDTRIMRKLLFNSDPIKITAVVTSLQVVNANKQYRHAHLNRVNNSSIVEPIVFETIFDLSILGKTYTITVEAPGTLSAALDGHDFHLENVTLVLDTVSLLKVMIGQTRAVVKKALKRAASIAATVTTYKQQESSSKCIANSSSSSSSSSDDRKKGCEQLRDTVEVEHSKPASQHEDDNLNNQGFPPNLLQTLKSLSADAANMDSSDSQDGSSSYDILQAQRKSEELHKGLFTWINNEDMMLKRSRSNGNGGNLKKRDSIEMHGFSIPQPLSKRNKKVSFIL